MALYHRMQECLLLRGKLMSAPNGLHGRVNVS